MKKILPYILTFLIIVNLFAPISVELEKNKIAINKNVAMAAYSYKLKVTPTLGSNYIIIEAEALNGSSVNDGTNAGMSYINTNLQAEATVYNGNKKVDSGIGYFGEQARTTTIKLNGKLFSSLTPETQYKTKIELKERITTTTNAGTTSSGTTRYNVLDTKTINTPTIKEGEAEKTIQAIDMSGSSNTIAPKVTSSSIIPPCSITGGLVGGEGTFSGCIAQGLYYLIFQPTSYLFALSGKLFDTIFAYSVNDNSYRSPFVLQGWGIVRDFCNMFFIFVLLYVAFSTILGIGGGKTKEMIINVVLIGIFINFSLFATQVIIDASNIMARVFYNSDAIKITDNGANGVTNLTTKADDSGVIPISAAIVNKVNPQNLIINSKNINTIEDTKGKAGGVAVTEEAMTTGTFMLVTILASAINLVGFWVFLTIAIIFVTRVIGLWIAMILVPFAFLSYTVPSMQNFEMVGWKKWWSETLQLAFLAPVFIFFLYLILKFLDVGLGIMDTNTQTKGLTFVIGIVLPFAIIMVFLTKAKNIAKKMSGSIGEMAVKAVENGAKAVGTVALGVASGGASMAMKGGIGMAGAKLAGSEGLNAAAAKGGFKGLGAKALLGIGKSAGSASFDIRNTKLASNIAGKAGIKLGKVKEGGWMKMKEEQIAKAQKRAKEYEVGENSPLKQKLNQEELDAKLLKQKNAKSLDSLNPKIEALKEARTQANADLAANPKDEGYIEAAQEAAENLKAAQKEKKTISNGGLVVDPVTGKPEKDANGNPTNRYHTDNGKISQGEVDNLNKKAKEDEEKAAAEKVKADKAKEEQKIAEDKLVEANKDPANTAAIDKAKEELKTAKEAAEIVKKTAEVKQKTAEDSKAAAIKASDIAKGGVGKSIFEFDTKFIPEAQHALDDENNERKINQAAALKSKSSKLLNYITSGGQYSSKAADQAARNIIMNVKTKND